jgi:hypothetical protein
MQLDRRFESKAHGEIGQAAEIKRMKNHRNFAFQLTPRLNFTSHDEYVDTLGYYKQLLKSMSFSDLENDKYTTLKR